MEPGGVIAKVSRPRLTGVLPRRRLFARLDALRKAHAVPWITGMAGAGKTTLVVSWLEQRRIPALWYRVDERDDDCAELFYTTRLAVEALEGDRSARIELPTFSPAFSPEPDAAEVGRFTRRFFEAVFARVPAGGVLVFDDFHLAPERSSWVEAFARAIEQVPSGINIVVLSRRAPPPALARACLHDDVGQLDSRELLLTEAELVAMAKSPARRRRPWSRADLAHIHAATGGWAAGVRLLMRRPGAVHAPSADDDVQVAFDYLASAVFADLDAGAQSTLLRAAVLPRFTAADVAALDDVPRDAAAARSELAGLHRGGWFIESEGPSGRDAAFRLHSLFREFLAQRAAATLDPAVLRAWRARAADLLRRTGRDDEAFELFRELAMHDAMRALILERAPARHAEGRMASVGRWLSALDEERVAADGWLTYWRAICTITSSPATSRAAFERALARFVADRDAAGAYLAWAGGMQATAYETTRHATIETWLARLADIERVCPAFPSADVGLAVAGSLVMALTLAGVAPDVLEHWVMRALALADKAADPTVRVMTRSVLMLQHALRGNARHASALAQSLTFTDERRAEPSALIARIAAHAAAATLAWHRADAEAGARAAREGLELLGDDERVPIWQSALLVFGCWAALDLDDGDGLNTLLRRLEKLAEAGSVLDISAYRAVVARDAMARGQLRAALEGFEVALDHDRVGGFGYGQAADLLAISFLAHELGDDERAAEALAAARVVEAQQRAPLFTFWRLVIEADRALHAGDRPRAVALLREAFALGRAGDIYNTQCPLPPRLSELCALALAEGIEPDYVTTMIKRRHLPPPPESGDVWPWPLRVRLLGPLSIEHHGAPVDVGRARMTPRLLRALVALAPARADDDGRAPLAVPTWRVIAALWPDADGDAGTHAFEVTLSRLRKQLGADGHRALRLEGERVWLDRSVCWVDVHALDALLRSVRRSPPAAPDEARAAAARLIGLYRFPFCEDDETVPALVAFDRKLRARVSAAVDALGATLERGGDAAGARGLRAAAHMNG